MFISMVGESGAGKKTLAKIIRREMEPEMDFLVCYDMEPGSKAIDLIAEVYIRAVRQLDPNSVPEPTEDEVIRTHFADKLRDILSGKRYLLILGGIPSITTLNSVRASLPNPEDNKNGGHVMLILDTENEEVAWHANTMNKDGINRVHTLTRLDQARTKELFYWKVLKKGQEEIKSRFSSARLYGEDDGDVYGGLVTPHNRRISYGYSTCSRASPIQREAGPVGCSAPASRVCMSPTTTTGPSGWIQPAE
jgi:hypothetical protein